MSVGFRVLTRVRTCAPSYVRSCVSVRVRVRVRVCERVQVRVRTCVHLYAPSVNAVWRVCA